MRSAPELSVVVPALNEELRIARTLEDVGTWLRRRGTDFELLVIDDGSTDGTSRVVSRLAEEFKEIRLIRLAVNGGKGLAVRTGVVNASGRAILFMDADGATPISELLRLEAALEAGADVAIGSRAKRDAEVTVTAKRYRHLMGRTFHWFVSLLTVKGIGDTQCGFKLFRSEVAHHLFSRSRMTGFSFDVEVLLMAQQCGYTIHEVPVNWSHQEGSRVNLVLDSARMLRDVLLIRKHSLSGAYAVPHVAMTSPRIPLLPHAVMQRPPRDPELER